MPCLIPDNYRLKTVSHFKLGEINKRLILQYYSVMMNS